MQFCMAMGIPIGKLTGDTVAVPQIELRRLVGHGVHVSVNATAIDGDAFRFRKQAGPNAVAAPIGMHGHDGDAQPGELRVGEETADDFAI